MTVAFGKPCSVSELSLRTPPGPLTCILGGLIRQYYSTCEPGYYSSFVGHLTFKINIYEFSQKTQSHYHVICDMQLLLSLMVQRTRRSRVEPALTIETCSFERKKIGPGNDRQEVINGKTLRSGQDY